MITRKVSPAFPKLKPLKLGTNISQKRRILLLKRKMLFLRKKKPLQ